MKVRYEWDEAKNRTNQRKHRVSFEEASYVFLDPAHVSIQDRVEDGEERWQTLGVVGGVLLLMAAHLVTEQSDATVIRVISARQADRRERRFYEEENS